LNEAHFATLIFFLSKQTISPQVSSKGKGIMKKNSFIFSFVLLISCDMMAQKQDLITARPLVQKGEQGDIILGKERKKSRRRKTAGTGPFFCAG